MTHILRQTLDNKNGIALILVVSIMAVLASIAAAFSYSMIMDQRAAANYMTGVKADYIAKAGIQHAIGVLKRDGDVSNTGYCNYEGYDWYGDDWGYDSTLFGADDGTGNSDSNIDNDGSTITQTSGCSDGYDSRWVYLKDSQGHLIGRYAVLVLDESGKVNINTAGTSFGNEGWTTSEVNLAKLCDLVLGTSDASDTILIARYGDPCSPGVSGEDDNHDSVVLNNDGIDNDGDGTADGIGDEGTDDSAEFYIARPYTDANGLSADTPFVTIAEVVSLAGMTGGNYSKLSPYITAWSSDKNLIGIGCTEDSGLWRLNINAVSDAYRLYKCLRDACEYWEPSTTYSTKELAQMAVNIIDYRDFNHGSTRIKVENKNGKIVTRWGVEGIRINEIMVRPVFRKDASDVTLGTTPVGWAGGPPTWTSENKCDSGIWGWSDIPIGTYKVHVYGSGNVDYLIYPDDGVWSDTHYNVCLSDTSTNDTVVILEEGAGTGTGPFMINIISKKMPWESPVSWYRVDLSQSPDCEYVEIVNISEKSINIKDWQLEFPNGQVGTIPDKNIGPGAYAVLAIDKNDYNKDGISVEKTWFSGNPTDSVYQLVFYEHSTADSAFDDILSDTVLIDSPLRLYDGPIASTIDLLTGVASPAGHIVDQVLWDS